MTNGLTTFRLDYLLPPLGDDPGVEAHARRLLAENRSYFKRLASFVYSRLSRSTFGPMSTGEMERIFGFVPDCDGSREQNEHRLLLLARQSSIVRLLRVSYFIKLPDNRVRSRRSPLSPPLTPPGWAVWTPNIVLSMRHLLVYTFEAWARQSAASARRFVSDFLARQEEQASSETAAGIFALVDALLLMLDSAPAAFARLVEPLTRRVLAAGGQTAVFIPLT